MHDRGNESQCRINQERLWYDLGNTVTDGPAAYVMHMYLCSRTCSITHAGVLLPAALK